MHNKIILNFKFLIMNVVDMQKSNSTFNIKNLSLTSVALFGQTAKQWRESNPDLKGNIRDYADVNQLVCLANLESLNAHLISENIPQNSRLQKLNKVAINQMRILIDDKTIKKIGSGI